jgi:uncharacterized membrane protein YdjX (TVP38/TMEM64 family)
MYGKGVLAFLVKAEVIDDFKQRLSKAATPWDMAKFMLLTRVTPAPNVLVNLASPLLGVPLYIFAPTTMLGLPLSIIYHASVRQVYDSNVYCIQVSFL